MARTINEILECMRGDPEIRELLMQGAAAVPPNRKRKQREHVTDEEDRMFKKIWASHQGLLIRTKLELASGELAGIRDAARLYYREVTGESKP